MNDRLEETNHKWTERKPTVADKIDEEITDCLAVFCLTKAHRKRLRTTNALERFNVEIRRRTRVVRVFPNEQSALRLIATLAMEQGQDGGKWYLDTGPLEEWSAPDDEMARAVLQMVEGVELTGAGLTPAGRSRQQE